MGVTQSSLRRVLDAGARWTPVAGGRRSPLAIALLCGCCSALFGDAGRDAWQIRPAGDRWTATGGGFSARHFVHIGPSHLVLNHGRPADGVAAGRTLFRRACNGSACWAYSLVSMLVSAGGFWLVDTDMLWYVGLFRPAAWPDRRRSNRRAFRALPSRVNAIILVLRGGQAGMGTDVQGRCRARRRQPAATWSSMRTCIGAIGGASRRAWQAARCE